MEMNKKDYGEYVSRHVPRSKAGRNMLRAFLTGGLICTIGQVLRALYDRAGLESEAAAGAVSVNLIRRTRNIFLSRDMRNASKRS